MVLLSPMGASHLLLCSASCIMMTYASPLKAPACRYPGCVLQKLPGGAQCTLKNQQSMIATSAALVASRVLTRHQTFYAADGIQPYNCRCSDSAK